MLPINELSNTELQKIRIACAYLFSPVLARNDEFLEKLNLVSVENAYTEKEKRYNPGIHPDESEEIIKKRKERSVKIRESYETLKFYMPKEKKPYSEAKQSRIIAVVGAKGGQVRVYLRPTSVFCSLPKEDVPFWSIWTSAVPIFIFVWAKLHLDIPSMIF